MVEIALVDCRDMPAPDQDAAGMETALAAADITATTLAWDASVDWTSFPLVVLRTPWDYIDRLDDFLAWVDATAAATTLLNPAPVVHWNCHKRYLFDLEAAGVPIVPTRQVAQFCPSAFQRVVLRQFTGEVVIKPAVSIGARATERWPADTLEAVALLEALTLLGDVLVQPLVPSIGTYGEVSLVFLGGEFSHAVRKVPASGDFRVHEYLGGSLVDHAPTAAELDVATAALAAVDGDLLYARVDLVSLDTGPAVMELELIEPELFLRRSPDASERFAAVIAERLRALA